MNGKIHIVLLWTIILAIWPVLTFIDSRYAHAEDAARTHTQLMFQTQQNGITIQRAVNAVEIRRLTNKMHQKIKLTPYEEVDYTILQQQKLDLQKQQQALDSLIRQEIK